MTVFFDHAFKCGDFGSCPPTELYEWGATHGIAEVVLLNGVYVARFTVPPINSCVESIGEWRSPPLYYRFDVFIDQTPDLGETINLFNVFADGVGWVALVHVYNDAGTLKWMLKIRDPVEGLLTYTSEQPLSVNTKYCVTVEWKLGKTNLYVNEVKVIETLKGGGYNVNKFFAGSSTETMTPSNPIHIYVSRVIVSDVYMGCEEPPIPEPPPTPELPPSIGEHTILRHQWVYTGPDPEGWVDKIVADNPLANVQNLVDLDPMGVLRYQGYSPEQGWGYDGDVLNLETIKRIINRFHKHGWKAVMETTGIAWTGKPLYPYIRDKHPELCFVNANGQYCGLPTEYGGDGRGTLIPDWFARFASDDPELGISMGERFIDVYCTRLRQMILDGAIVWDGWFGTDGWNGFPIWGYLWYTSNPTNWISASEQELGEWAAETSVPLPADWGLLTNLEKATWIMGDGDAAVDWWNYWKDRWAQLYAQIRNAIKVNPNALGNMIQCDVACVWDGWHHAPYGMWDVWAFQRHGSIDIYFIASEVPLHQRAQSLTAGLIKSKNPSARCVAGLPLTSYGVPFPFWQGKQIYLAELCCHVWFNKRLYRACDPKLLFAEWANEWDTSIWPIFEWANKIRPLFDQILTPIWLGPVYILPRGYVHEDGAFVYPLVYSQWVDIVNLEMNPGWTPPDPMPCPILSTQPDVLDLKILQTLNGKIIVPMLNMTGGGSGDPLDVTLNVAGLGLSPPENWKVYWQSDGILLPIDDWHLVSVKLKDGADVLVIEPLAPIPPIPKIAPLLLLVLGTIGILWISQEGA